MAEQFQIWSRSKDRTGNNTAGNSLRVVIFYKMLCKYCAPLNCFIPNISANKIAFAINCKGVAFSCRDACTLIPVKVFIQKWMKVGGWRHYVQHTTLSSTKTTSELGKISSSAQAWVLLLKEKCPSVTAFDPRLVLIWWNWQPFNRKQSCLILCDYFIATFILK